MKTGPYFEGFLDDACVNHVDNLGWGGGCINVHVDVKEKGQ